MPKNPETITGKRVEIAPHFDLWMMGARYGTITRTIDHKRVWVTLDHPSVLRPQRFLIADLTILD